jgi:2-oxoisovalerate dehydrogenase E1 component
MQYSSADLLEIYRLMVLSRRTDETEKGLLLRGKTGWSAASAGCEAAGVVAGFLLRKTDPILTTYRDRAVVIARGVTPYEMFLEALSARTDPASGGRQMSCHWGHKKLAVLPSATPTGAQCLPAQGVAEAMREGDGIVYVSVGDSTVSQGEFYEALKSACLTRSPIIFHALNNEYGISVHIREQHPEGRFLNLFQGWPSLKCLDVDGTSVFDSLPAWKEAIDHARSRKGPVLLQSRVVRLYSHSSSDDQRKYRPAGELAREQERDPIPKYERELLAFRIATEGQLKEIRDEIEAELTEAVIEASREPKTDVGRLMADVFQPDAKSEYESLVRNRRSEAAGRTLKMSESLNQCLMELMELDSRIVVWGEDIADMPAHLLKRHRDELEGKGGVFGVTKGLQRKFGNRRAFNSPLAEATIVGKAVGYAARGFRPVVEIQFRDFLSPGWTQLVDIAATTSYRSGGHYACPIVVRMASGGYLLGAGGPWHSEMAAGALMHYPGLQIAVPSNGRNAPMLLRAAIYSNNPVVLLEPKSLYARREGYFETPYPDFDQVAWPGTSETIGDGKDLAIVTFGNTTWMTLDAVRKLEEEGVRARVVNLLWLNPLDEESIRSAADECGALLVVDEDRETCGAGMAILNALWKDPDLRRRVDADRVCAKNCRVPFGEVGERYVLPQVEDIYRAALKLVRSKQPY